MDTGIRTTEEVATSGNGLAGWLLARLRRVPRRQPSLALLERINLAPRQSLALVEAEGRRFLVATSPEGAPAFYALDRAEPGNRIANQRPLPAPSRVSSRVSW
ncbi:MAG TPA: flagellar biosynthetic protein FliO [Terracidiphilus sp.]|jgi:flagellar biogenesis protein FliO